MTCSIVLAGRAVRVALTAAGAIALAAITLAACASDEPPVLGARQAADQARERPADQSPDQPAVVALVSSPLAHPAVPVEARLGDLLERAPDSVVAGQSLNVALLRRFYARHGFAPVWTSRPAQAEALTKALSRAGEHGLDPALFHADLLRAPDTLPALDRELLLSDGVLSYADALARGAVPVERRRDDEVLAPAPIDVAAVLDAALRSDDPAAAIEALAPDTPSYRQLREALRTAQPGGPAAGKPVPGRARAIAVNLERQRWLPRQLPADRVWVNAADERLVLYRDDRPVFSTRVIVGRQERHNQSPEFQAMIERVMFNPPWNVPPDIADREILPRARRDPGYLARHDMVMLPDGILQQRAGPGSGLGQLLFEMDNRFDVYLHDTPSRNLFLRDDRRISHGCIRVEKPRELAALLMRQPVEAIDQAIATGDTNRVDLPTPVPVFVVYQTAFADAEGRLQFRADSYARDAEIWQALEPKRQAVAQRAPPVGRGG